METGSAPASAERLVTAVRVLLARELASRGMGTGDIARALGLTPAAVSMYLSGKRGSRLAGELAKDSRVLTLMRNCAEAIIRAARGGAAEPCNIAELADVVASIVSQRGARESLEELVARRMRLEQEVAVRAMTYSYRTRNPLVRALLMQIAADSMRHAEILAMLLDYFSGKLKAEGLDILPEELDALAAGEDSMKSEIAELYRLCDPVATALLLSIELDERKHRQLVISLKTMARAQC